MATPLADRIALVTGASRGIGHATALALARGGAHVIAVARTVGGLEELDDAIKAAGGSATLVPLDLKDYGGIDRLGASLNERYGKLDVPENVAEKILDLCLPSYAESGTLYNYRVKKFLRWTPPE